MESLLSRIERSAKKSDYLNRASKAIFLAHKEEIQEALNKGWTVKLIWQTLHAEGKYPSTYQNFAKHVRRFIHGYSESSNLKENKKEEDKDDKKISYPSSSGFDFNPVFDPKKLYGEEE